MTDADDIVDIGTATRSYERWLAKQVPLVAADVRRKHREMRKDPFRFFRATYYRWIQRAAAMTDRPDARPVLAIGDLHIENFGTWRDSEGRLVWGVNDFDEVDERPFTDDLIRLTASAILAKAIGRMRLRPVDIAEAVLLGYRDSLAQGGEPFVLGERHRWLRETAMNDLRDPVAFWQKILTKSRRDAAAPRRVRSLLDSVMPGPRDEFRIARRIAGLGSLGKPRFVATAVIDGGWIAREARSAIMPSSAWLAGAPRKVRYMDALRTAIRCPDPFVEIRSGWLIRRLAPDCSRIDLETLPKRYDEYRLMHAMGWETANVHLGSASARTLTRELRALGRKWLPASVETMLDALHADWNAFRGHGPS
jgi:Uncharacterized protein conserved in bacteria (DUF2252)